MKLTTKRLFISNLPDNVNESDIKQKFAHFGVVSFVDIKERKNIGVNQTAHFAYVQLDIDATNLQDCLTNINEKKWKGHWINAQEAKESFMERLKREREELKLNGTSTKTSTTMPVYCDNVPNTVKQSIEVNRKVYHSSSSESEDDEQDSGFVSGNNKQLNATQNGLLKSDEDLDKLVIKSNKGTTIRDKLKIAPLHGESVNLVKKEVKKLDRKETDADKKRLQSIAQMKKEYRQQKSAIKNALLNIDSTVKNKIIFDNDADDNAEKIPHDRSKNEERKNSKQDNKIKQKKLTLFEEEPQENDPEEYNFEIKEHLEGKKGQKLMELQSRFKNDKRFVMDARFLEGDPDEQSENEKQYDQNEEITLEQEKQKEYDILEQVLGKKVPRKPTDKELTESKRRKMMLRFDPSQPEHSKYEVKEPAKKEGGGNKRKRTDSDKDIEATVEEATKPEVSKDTFYKIAVDFKSTLQENEGFSLANMFNKEIEVEQDEEEQYEAINKQKKISSHDPNPFKYDSSSEDEVDETTNKKTEHGEKTPKTDISRSTPFWTESFFFKKDDYRLQEGLDFIKRLEGDDQGDFLMLRRNLKKIVRAKVRNNQRNNRPFKRKLGGKKRIRVKRAMKR